ncbi:hypothetical protein XENTR_v10018304 [Xenopus tropicalis]|nr:hypothetical protein XENTR_v10018304 [Xenopus tropicalis]
MNKKKKKNHSSRKQPFQVTRVTGAPAFPVTEIVEERKRSQEVCLPLASLPSSPDKFRDLTQRRDFAWDPACSLPEHFVL